MGPEIRIKNIEKILGHRKEKVLNKLFSTNTNVGCHGRENGGRTDFLKENEMKIRSPDPRLIP